MRRLLARLFPRPGYGWPVEATGLHGARSAEARVSWLREQRQLLAAQQPAPQRLSATQQEAIRALNGRTPTYWEAVEIMGLNRRYDPFVGTPGKHEIVWMGVKLEPPTRDGLMAPRPEMHAVLKP